MTISGWLISSPKQPSISLYLKENRTNAFKGKYLFKLVN